MADTVLAALRRGADAGASFRVVGETDRSMADILEEVEARDLFHIVESTVKAALYLKKTFGRSHGNLKPSNIFLEGAGKRSARHRRRGTSGWGRHPRGRP